MTATDELRRMLDERGVEWSGIGDHTVLWCRRDAKYANYDAQASYWGDKLMLSWACTPEQAVEATLGDADATGERQRDAVEVVRCRDCEHFAVDQSDHDYRTGWWCKRWYTDMVKPDGFCAWGETEEGER